jgi:hypothetical protein
MDGNGDIHDLDALKMTDGDAAAEDWTMIPPKLITRVTFLTHPQRRSWRELVRGGMSAEEALVKVQQATGASGA